MEAERDKDHCAVKPACMLVRFGDLASRSFDWPDLIRETPEDLSFRPESFSLRLHLAGRGAVMVDRAEYKRASQRGHREERRKLGLCRECGHPPRRLASTTPLGSAAAPRLAIGALVVVLRERLGLNP